MMGCGREGKGCGIAAKLSDRFGRPDLSDLFSISDNMATHAAKFAQIKELLVYNIMQRKGYNLI